MTTAVQMNANIITRAIRVESKSSGVEQLHLRCVDVALKIDPFAAIVEIISAGVNPSDVKAVLGAMPQAVWPRTRAGTMPKSCGRGRPNSSARKSGAPGGSWG